MRGACPAAFSNRFSAFSAHMSQACAMSSRILPSAADIDFAKRLHSSAYLLKMVGSLSMSETVFISSTFDGPTGTKWLKFQIKVSSKPAPLANQGVRAPVDHGVVMPVAG